MKKILLFLWNLSIGKLYRILFKPPKKLRTPNIDFLKSQRYQDLMNEHIPYDGNYGRYESSTYTRSYINRHHNYAHELGVFRWRGMQEYLSIILPLISDSEKTVVDFGGGGCPLGMNSILVDRLNYDLTKNKIRYHSLNELPSKPDVIFASHVFEHVKNLDEVLLTIKNQLNTNGYLICFVPSFSNKFWNAGIHNNEKFGGHVWTCGLAETDKNTTKTYPNYIDIDNKIKEYLDVEKAEYCGDDSIFILAKKK